MLSGKGNEIVNIRFYGLNATLHSWNGIALSTKTYAASHHGTELAESDLSCSTTVHASKIASEHKDFICLQFRDIIRRICRALDSVVFFHSNANLAKENGPRGAWRVILHPNDG